MDQIKVFYKTIYDRDIDAVSLDNWQSLYSELADILRRKGYNNIQDIWTGILNEYALKINKLKQIYTEQQTPTKEQMAMYVDELVEKEKMRFSSIKFMVLSRARQIAANSSLVISKMGLFAAVFAIVIILIVLMVFQLARPVLSGVASSMCSCCGGRGSLVPRKSICASKLRNYSQCISLD